MDGSDLARLAESMAEFVEAKTKLTVGPIHRPPMISKKQMALIVAAGLILSPWTVQRVVMLFALFVSILIKKVIQLDNWKTGYGLQSPELWFNGKGSTVRCVIDGQAHITSSEQTKSCVYEGKRDGAIID
ncbi:hypothetical protein HAX54_009419 [Datura stramonium]|uniref:Uncharacterized protein n=1 Tax=Datura stramonium TaxID=4076 RepID=A0ABS8RW76_DATST|nr:hypothetical protein [Datura stramonium]